MSQATAFDHKIPLKLYKNLKHTNTYTQNPTKRQNHTTAVQSQLNFISSRVWDCDKPRICGEFS